jgi:hypothetical protein
MMPSSFSQVWFTQVKKSLWNPVKSTTLEHNHFGIALEHKMLHHIISDNTQQTGHQIYWQAQHFGRFERSKAMPLPKKTPMRDLVLTSSLPLSWLLLLSDLGIYYAQLRCHLGLFGAGGGVHTQPFRV